LEKISVEYGANPQAMDLQNGFQASCTFEAASLNRPSSKRFTRLGSRCCHPIEIGPRNTCKLARQTKNKNKLMN
jgi:hypothetical protein